MTMILIASSEPRVGRSLIAAAVATIIARAGTAVTLARLAGDESAAPDATAFAALDGVSAPAAPLDAAALATIQGETVVEAPAGPVAALVRQLGAKVIVVGRATSPEADAPQDALIGSIVTNATPSDIAAVRGRHGLLAALPEDPVLAAPSVADIVAALGARVLAGGGTSPVGAVMIGTIASDAATPYFVNRGSTCVVTRFDKTDVQLAALSTDLRCLVLTGGGEPSPYLLDRVAGHRPDVDVLLADGDTVDAMHAIEPLFGASRFGGEAKLARAVGLLDAAGFTASR